MEKQKTLNSEQFEVKLFNQVIQASQIKTLLQVAAITSKDVSQLYNWSAGKKTPKMSTILEISQKLGVVVEFPIIRKIKLANVK